MSEFKSEPLSLHYSQEDIEEAKGKYYDKYPNNNDLHWACLNRILSNKIVEWIQEQGPINSRVENSLSVSFGELQINWSTINLGGMRVVNMIGEKNYCRERKEIRVPQECVDNPESDDCKIVFWEWLEDRKELYELGSITPDKLKQKERYEPVDGTYGIKEYQLVENLFNYEWIQQLYDRSIGVPAVRSWRVRLENVFDETWQTVAEIIDIIGTPERPWKDAVVRSLEDDEPMTEKMILELISRLSTSKDKLTRLDAIEWLGNAHGNQEAIAGLQDLLNSSDDPDLRREAAVSLGEIDPGNEQAGIRRGKMINLGPLHQVALAITLMPGANRDQMQINLRVNSVGSPFLPRNLEMSVLDENGSPFDKIRSRNNDDGMQLVLAGGEEGDRFTVMLALGHDSFTEEFVL